jgi:hypothetical protein
MYPLLVASTPDGQKAFNVLGWRQRRDSRKKAVGSWSLCGTEGREKYTDGWRLPNSLTANDELERPTMCIYSGERGFRETQNAAPQSRLVIVSESLVRLHTTILTVSPPQARARVRQAEGPERSLLSSVPPTL